MDLLELRGITKRFGSNTANDHIDFTVREGEIHALFGENGAGKTTLMNILFGLYDADEGEIFFNGKKVNIHSPLDAIELGIGMVHQHFMLVQRMTLLQNLVLGLKPEGYPLYNKKRLLNKFESLAEQYGLAIDLNTPVRQLSVGAQQRGEIMKTLYRNAKLIILDEPTAVLTPQETEDFFAILKSLKSNGHSIILISHKLQELMDNTDRVTVLRDGKVVTTVNTAETTPKELSNYMIGRELSDAPYQRIDLSQEDTIPLLEAEHVTIREKNGLFSLNDISLSLNKGEILGVAGVDGNGQKELAEAITGIRKLTEGRIILEDTDISRLSVRQRFEKGISYVSDDRHADSLIMDADVQDNTILRQYYRSPFSNRGVINREKVVTESNNLIEQYHIKTDSLQSKVRLLSGGNQQKLILGRELSGTPKLIVACQPTRGLDIGATEQMRGYLMDCRNKGNSVLLISTDLDEIIRMADRILVINSGTVMGILKNENPDINLIGRMMAGEKQEESA